MAPPFGSGSRPDASRRRWLIGLGIAAAFALVVAAAVLVSIAGDDEFPANRAGTRDLGELWEACEYGDMEACDDLYLESPFGSEAEEFGGSCGNRRPSGFRGWCADG